MAKNETFVKVVSQAHGDDVVGLRLDLPGINARHSAPGQGEQKVSKFLQQEGAEGLELGGAGLI